MPKLTGDKIPVICPLMSVGEEVVACAKNRCPLYVRTYTVHNEVAPAECAIALIPQTVDGKLRV